MKNIRQKAIILAIINLGIISILAQVLLIRELILAFYGNELFISLVLAFWLISTGLGSLWLGQLIKSNEKIIFRLHILISIILVNAIILARLARSILAEPGVIPNIIWATLWSLLVVIPTGLLLGMIFVVLAKVVKQISDQAVTHAYILESLGFFIGALLFNFILFQLAGLSLIFVMVIFNLIIALIFSFYFSWRQPITITILIITIAIGLSLTTNFDQQLFNWHYPKQEIVSSVNSKFGSIQVTKIAGQTNFYYNGQIVAIDQDKYNNELLADLPMLLIDNTKNVLVIGNAFTGLINEINKYHPEQIVYLELDKTYLETAEDWIDFNQPENLQIIYQDARTYLNNTKQTFDVIIINYANPSTLAENRYFTQEFFKLINKHLTKQALAILKINTTPNYTFGAQNQLLASLYQTLKTEFNHVLALPENEVVYLAGENINYDKIKMQQKYQDLDLKNQYLFPAYIDWRFTNDRTIKLNQQLINPDAKINSDFKPTLYYLQLKIFLEKMQLTRLLWWTIGMLLILLVLINYKLQATSYKLLIISSIPEFCLISFEVLLILLFQTFHGYLYTQLSLIIALVLVGIALGSLLTRKLLETKDALRILKLSYLIILLAFTTPSIIVWQWQFIFNYKLFYYLISLLAGFAIGTKFPVINKLYLKNPPEGRTQNLGAVYGVDLIGGAVGALLAGIFMLPVIGMIGSLGVLVGLCIIGFMLLLLKTKSW